MPRSSRPSTSPAEEAADPPIAPQPVVAVPDPMRFAVAGPFNQLVLDDPTHPLYLRCNFTQFATTPNASDLIKVRGDSAFKADARVLAGMDMGYMRDHGSGQKLPWDRVQLRNCVLLETEVRELPAAAAEEGDLVTTTREAMWRRVAHTDARLGGRPPAWERYNRDDMYGLRKLRLSGLKAIFGGLDLESEHQLVKDRVDYLFEGLDASQRAAWTAYIKDAQAKNFASGLSVDIAALLATAPSYDATGAGFPLEKRVEAEPQYEREKKPRQEWDSAIPVFKPTPRAKPVEPADDDDADLFAAPPHLFPILNGGAEHITSVYDLPSSASIHQSKGQIIISVPTSSLKRVRPADDESPGVPVNGQPLALLSRKQRVAFDERVSVTDAPGGMTFMTLSGNPSHLKIEPNKGTPGAYLVFHGPAPPRLLGAGTSSGRDGGSSDTEDASFMHVELPVPA